MARLTGYLTNKEIKQVENRAGVTLETKEKLEDSRSIYYVVLDCDWTIQEFLDAVAEE